MDAPDVSIPKRSPSRLEIACTLVCLVVWLYESSKPGNSWAGFISAVALLALGIPWFIRSLEFVRASVVPWAGMGLILAAIAILAVTLSFSRDPSGSALIGFSMVFLVFLLIAFPVFCATAGLLKEGWRLGKILLSGGRQSDSNLREEILSFFSWMVWPAALILMVFMNFVPILLAIRVQMSEPALLGLIQQLEAHGRQRMDVYERVGFITVVSVKREEDHVCLVTDKFDEIDSAGLAYAPGVSPKLSHFAGRRIYGPWWKWRRAESWFHSIGKPQAEEESSP